ncbi:MAG: putative lipoprotein [Gammaproteobacteria bacterium]|nr:putative lipoprotein [Gammaproteobacteria bacterium]
MIRALLCLSVLSLAGCVNLYAGISRYEISPLQDANGKITGCCTLRVTSGKEYAAINAKFIKTGEDYSIVLDEQQIEAFKGQAVIASAASDVAGAISNTAIAAAKLIK